MKGSKYDLSDKAAILIIASVAMVGIIFVVAVTMWASSMSKQSIEITNTGARCKSAGGEMGHSKCYKDGREI